MSSSVSSTVELNATSPNCSGYCLLIYWTLYLMNASIQLRSSWAQSWSALASSSPFTLCKNTSIIFLNVQCTVKCTHLRAYLVLNFKPYLQYRYWKFCSWSIGKFPTRTFYERKIKSQMPTARFNPTSFRSMHQSSNHLATTIVSAAGIVYNFAVIL